MSRKKAEFIEVVSFRLTENEKTELEAITENNRITKSEFLRTSFKAILSTSKI